MDGFNQKELPGLPGVNDRDYDTIEDYKRLFNNSIVGIFRCRFSDGMLFQISQGALDLLGVKMNYSQGLYEWLGKDLFTIPASDSYGETTRTEFEYERGGGVKKWLAIDWISYPETDVLVGMITDITENKRLEAAMKVMREEMDTFIYHASHQLKSPITTMLGAAYLLRVDSANAKTINTYCDIVESQIHRLNRLFKELMHVFANHHAEVARELIDFHVLAGDTLAELTPRYPDVRVNTEISGEVDFYGDRERLGLILKNLVSNALKFRDPDSTDPEINIGIAITPGTVVISVKDNGISIEENTLKNDLFKIFFKGTEQSKYGFGLGLYLVKSIVDKMKGTITARSSPGNGSEFIVRIPDTRMYVKPPS